MDNILIYSARPPERAAPFDNGPHPKPYTTTDIGARNRHFGSVPGGDICSAAKSCLLEHPDGRQKQGRRHSSAE
jgi:hypothetical protein